MLDLFRMKALGELMEIHGTVIKSYRVFEFSKEYRAKGEKKYHQQKTESFRGGIGLLLVGSAGGIYGMVKPREMRGETFATKQRNKTPMLSNTDQ